MAVSTVVHTTVVVVPDDGVSPVGTTEWNAGHEIPNSAITGAMLAATAIDGKTIAPASVASTGAITQKGMSIGGVARIIAAAAIANTETQVLGISIPANFMVAGTSFRIRAVGRITTGATGGSSIFRCRIGPTTLTGNIPATLTVVNTNSVTAGPLTIDIDVTVRSAGAGGTCIGQVVAMAQTAVPIAFNPKDTISAISATVVVDTTVANIVELTYISGNAGSTLTFETVTLEIVNAT